MNFLQGHAISRRRRAIVLAVWVLGALSCSRAPEVDEVVIYCSVDRVVAEPILDAFAREAQVRVLPLYDTETAKTAGLAKRVLMERGSTRADVWWSGEGLFTAMLDAQGCLASASPRPQADPANSWSAVAVRLRVLVHRSDTWPADVPLPTSLEFLADPRLSGRCALARPYAGTTASQFAWLASTPQGLDLLRRIRANRPALLSGNADVARAVARGEAVLGLVDSDDVVMLQRDEPRLVATVPDQATGERGAMPVPMTVAIVAGAPHPTQAQAFVRWLAARRGLVTEVPGSFAIDGSASPPGLPALFGLHVATVDWSQLSRSWETSRTTIVELFGP